MKKIIAIIVVLSTLTGYSQEDKNDSIKKNKIKIFGGLESNAQWYLNDKNRELSHPDYPIRSNNYLSVNANYGRFSAGIQFESYQSLALLNYNPGFEGNNVGTFYANYKSNKLDVTAGHFYEQFGSGLIFRTWEDRALGINNALRGLRVKYNPTDNLMFTALYGKQRTGFHVVDSDIFGFNSDFNLSGLIGINNFDLSTGFSVISKKEDIDPAVIDPKFNKITNAYSSRINFSKGSFYFTTEYNFKDKEPVLVRTDLDNDFIKSGNALLINFGYSKKGFGLDANFRRIENMAFLSQRQPEVYAPEISSLYFNDRILNFVPALTKQHHSNLANIYVYQAQNRVAMQFDEQIQKFGEIGGQIDMFYEFKKGTKFGGKYGTKVSMNVSNWFNLDADYSYFDNFGNIQPDYKTKFFGAKEKYFSDYNIEFSKKLSSKFKGSLMYSNQYYNDQYIRGIFQENVIKSNILFVEGVYNIKGSRSITLGLEHMWADNDRGNWASFLLEYNHNQNWSIFMMDMYNYGFDKESGNVLISGHLDEFDIHFYNFGGSYRRGSTRIALNYGRQRGGLVCAGGVCRVVPQSTGVGLSLTSTF
ncbi:hypothetical protein GFJ94_10590 [Flavobacterium sp. LMO8]|uniref:DUF6029 family protein n=1 Tax=Flavobacterium sp. LMO8 TaxID=2654244 RepID=UPI0012926E21|nr:DUF6029 family protein [Flavobacterium sp. LMO8]MQP25513.1 hypothetical protein [Flavobacterium sp. LMO8]